jgi:hypothetical protein
MTAQGFALDDKLPLSGGTMSGTLNFEGSPPYTVVKNTIAGKVTLNGTSAVTVATTAVDADSLVLLTVQPGTAPVGIPYVATLTSGSGFTVKSTSGSDTAVNVAWSIVEAV